ncbi:MAG: hypothetical protein PUA72_07145 [Lachnospiraceae bacterium]|nr:hypothetical protein [Lachnospiraceae bacterium]
MREKLKTVKNAVVHILVLLLVFIGAVVLFEKLINQSTPNSAQDMENSTFPLVYMQNKGVSYNCLHGYAYEMDVTNIRDTVTVLGDSHELDIQIQPFSSNVESVSYEVLSLDGTESLENTKVVQLTEESNYLTATLKIQNNMLLNQEYILKLQVTAGGRDVYFYTRLLLEDGLHLEAYLNFVTGFYEKCVNKTDEATLGSAVEPDETTDQKDTLAEMDIHSSVNRLMWGNLNPQIFYKPTPSLVDINGTTASFVLDYRISAINSEGTTELYNVKEFYRLRYTDTRVFLLDFTRSTDEIFSAEGTVINSKGINLGVTSQDVEFAIDEKNKVAAFVQEDELWTYEINAGRMTRVFGFPQKENMDYRDFYEKNNIKILRVDSDGNVWFCVSGYMNRGRHEGENGIAVYYYEDASATVEEILFVKTMESYDMLKLDIGALAYITENAQDFYLLLQGMIYRIDLTTREYERVVDGINTECYTVSESNRYVAWLKEGARYDSQTLYRMDLETGAVQEITCDADDRIRPVAFMGEDLVYGVAHTSDIDTTHEGSELFPMYRLTIVGADGEERKNYEPGNAYVLSVEQSENMLVLSRVTRTENGYEETTEDHIVSTNTDEEVATGTTTQASNVKGSEVILRLGTTLRDTTVQTVNAKLLTDGAASEISIPTNKNREKLYYVYAGGSLESVWTTAAEAIRRADEKVGVVINDEKEFVWERGNRAETAKISVDKIPQAIQNGVMDLNTLESQLGKVVIDLTGCTLEQVLYFVGNRHPVLAWTGTETVIITGYDDYGNLILLKPGESETYFYGPEDSKTMFEAAGNQFMTYLNTDL